MSVRWLNKSYGVLDLGGPKAIPDRPSSSRQSLLASQLDTRVASLAVEQQTLRTTSDLTQDALKRAIGAVDEAGQEIRSRLDQLERALGVDPMGTLGLGPKYLTATRSNDQASNINDGDRVRLDSVTVDSGHITNTLGIFSIPAGVYELVAVCAANFSAPSGSVTLSWAVNGGGLLPGSGALVRPYTLPSDVMRTHVAQAIAELPTSTSVVLRINSPVNLTAIDRRTNIVVTALA